MWFRSAVWLIKMLTPSNAVILLLLAMKVVSQTSDVRMSFSVLHGAIDMVVSSLCSTAEEPVWHLRTSAQLCT